MILIPIFILCMFFSACNIGSKYKKPALHLPSHYTVSVAHNASYNNKKTWWNAFNSDQLKLLINEGLKKNLDLKSALEKIVESRNIHRIDIAKIAPELDFFSALVRGNTGDGLITNGRRYPSMTASLVALDTLWEIDVWGKLYRTQKASRYELEATIDDMHDVMLMLIAEIIQTYITLCSQTVKLNILRERDLLNKELLALYSDGFLSGLDTHQIPLEQTTAITSVETELLELLVQQRNSVNKLAFLLATTPDKLDLALDDIHEIPEIAYEPCVDEPYELLRTRPDIRKAEKLLRSSYEKIGAAVAEWFPTISLLGFLGRPSISACQLPSGQAKIWAVGPLFGWPILDFGRIYFNIKVQESSQRQALLQYERAVLNAIQEVENWLFAYATHTHKLSMVEKKCAQERKRYLLIVDLLNSGIESRLTELAGHIRVNEILFEVIDAQERRALSFVSLYKALGRGWQCIK